MAVYKSNKPTSDGRTFFFRIKYRDVYGNTHDYSSKKYKTHKEAVLAESKYRLSKVQEKKELINPTIKDIFNEYIIQKAKISKFQTVKKERNLFRYYSSIENIRINDLNVNRYKKFYEYVYHLPYSPGHRTDILQLLGRLIRYSTKNYNTSDALLRFIEPIKDKNQLKKPMDFYTYEEFQKFISVVNDLNYHLLFNTLYFTGVRIGEALGLQWKDVDFNKRTISINKTASTKLGAFYTLSTPKTKSSTRILPITKKLADEFKNVQKLYKKYSDYSSDFFVFGGVRPFPDTTIQKKKNKYCESAHLRKIRIHDFRHSFASFMINNGASIMLVSKYLGHSNSSITLNIYTHLYNSELTKMVEFVDKYIK